MSNVLMFLLPLIFVAGFLMLLTTGHQELQRGQWTGKIVGGLVLMFVSTIVIIVWQLMWMRLSMRQMSQQENQERRKDTRQKQVCSWLTNQLTEAVKGISGVSGPFIVEPVHTLLEGVYMVRVVETSGRPNLVWPQVAFTVDQNEVTLDLPPFGGTNVTKSPINSHEKLIKLVETGSKYLLTR